MSAIDGRIAQITTWLAAIVALLVMLALPLAYYDFAHRYQAGRVEAEAELNAYLVSQVITRDPVLWRFETTRIENLVARPSLRAVGGGDESAELRRVLDIAGTVVVEHATRPDGRVPWPVLVRSAPLYDSGHLAGRLEIQHSMRPILAAAGYVAAFALLLGGGAFFALRVLPLHALARACEEVAYLASHDPLTALPNRVLLRDRLEQAVARMRRQRESAAVLCLDLDGFKDVNTSLGHTTGDRLLQKVAARLRTCLRDSDTVARVGGDEFAIIQDGLNQPESAAGLARRLIEEVARPFHLDGCEVIVGASIGIALCGGEEDPDVLLKHADLALHRAKEDGGGGFRFFEEAMNQRLRARKAIESDLRQALAEGGFEVHYQPQIDLESQRITGMEALLRWQHAERGSVPPAEFISVAEETGLIVPLGEWVLRTACAQAVAWRPLTMAVNLSPAQFRQPDLVSMVARVLRDTGLEGKYLELEITEGILLHDTETTLAILRGLKAQDVRIAMDDFGTGYSSLSYLRRFPFDKIKIDRSFIHALAEEEEAAAIVRTIIALGRTLGMRATAEGVENQAQARMLRAEGCAEVQGYYFGRPAPAAELSRMLQKDLALSA